MKQSVVLFLFLEAQIFYIFHFQSCFPLQFLTPNLLPTLVAGFPLQSGLNFTFLLSLEISINYIQNNIRFLWNFYFFIPPSFYFFCSSFIIFRTINKKVRILFFKSKTINQIHHLTTNCRFFE